MPIRLRGAHMVFITAGMGGGNGHGRGAGGRANRQGNGSAHTVGVVSKPFEFEGGKRMRVAEAGSQLLEDHVDSLIVVLNDKLFEVKGDDAEMDKCFQCRGRRPAQRCRGASRKSSTSTVW
ncbi:MAG: hypothetical protein WDN30_06385 [Pararobbsia sp.]